VKAEWTSNKEALSAGAIAFVVDKYPDTVRMLRIGPPQLPRSLERCGGTHVTNTAHLLFFVITGQTGIGAGIRRIEAVAVTEAQERIERILHNSRHIYQELHLGSPFTDTTIPSALLKKIKHKEDEIIHLKRLLRESIPDHAASLDPQKFSFTSQGQQWEMVLAISSTLSARELTPIIENLKNKLSHQKKGMIVLAGRYQANQFPVAIVCTKQFCSTPTPLTARSLLEQMKQDLGGKGGGRTRLAQGILKTDHKNFKRWIDQWIQTHQ